MEKYLFRGKRIDNNQWIEGDGIHYPKSINYIGRCFIDGMEERANDWMEVDPKTIGRWIGKEDNNRKKIFEGDKVIAYNQNKKYGSILTVIYKNACFMFNQFTYDNLTIIFENIEIVGDIYEGEVS